jgi:hypothetical protein
MQEQLITIRYWALNFHIGFLCRAKIPLVCAPAEPNTGFVLVACRCGARFACRKILHPCVVYSCGTHLGQQPRGKISAWATPCHLPACLDEASRCLLDSLFLVRACLLDGKAPGAASAPALPPLSCCPPLLPMPLRPHPPRSTPPPVFPLLVSLLFLLSFAAAENTIGHRQDPAPDVLKARCPCLGQQPVPLPRPSVSDPRRGRPLEVVY